MRCLDEAEKRARIETRLSSILCLAVAAVCLVACGTMVPRQPADPAVAAAVAAHTSHPCAHRIAEALTSAGAKAQDIRDVKVFSRMQSRRGSEKLIGYQVYVDQAGSAPPLLINLRRSCAVMNVSER